MNMIEKNSLPILCIISSGTLFPTNCKSFKVEFDSHKVNKARPPISPTLFQRRSIEIRETIFSCEE